MMSHMNMFTMKSLATKDLFLHYVQTIVDTRKACVHLFEAHDLGSKMHLFWQCTQTLYYAN